MHKIPYTTKVYFVSSFQYNANVKIWVLQQLHKKRHEFIDVSSWLNDCVKKTSANFRLTKMNGTKDNEMTLAGIV